MLSIEHLENLRRGVNNLKRCNYASARRSFELLVESSHPGVSELGEAFFILAIQKEKMTQLKRYGAYDHNEVFTTALALYNVAIVRGLVDETIEDLFFDGPVAENLKELRCKGHLSVYEKN